MAPGPAGLNPRRRRGIAAGAGRAGAPGRPAPLTGAACVCICSRNPGGISTHRERHGRGRVSGAGAVGGGGRRGRVSPDRAVSRRSVSGLAAPAAGGLSAQAPPWCCRMLSAVERLGAWRGVWLAGSLCARLPPLCKGARREHSWLASREDLIS